jgi:hypothetical protein
MMITISGYQTLEKIYESANSLVYRGRRIQDNQPIILKVLKEDYPTPAELSRYKQEYSNSRCSHTSPMQPYHQRSLTACRLPIPGCRDAFLRPSRSESGSNATICRAQGTISPPRQGVVALDRAVSPRKSMVIRRNQLQR